MIVLPNILLQAILQVDVATDKPSASDKIRNLTEQRRKQTRKHRNIQKRHVKCRFCVYKMFMLQKYVVLSFV